MCPEAVSLLPVDLSKLQSRCLVRFRSQMLLNTTSAINTCLLHPHIIHCNNAFMVFQAIVFFLKSVATVVS